jgi:hypothetical protein
MSKLQKQKSAALKFANKVRKALCKSPLSRFPLGIPQSNTECSLAKAIDDSELTVDDEGIDFGDNAVKVYIVGRDLGYPVDLSGGTDGLSFDDVLVERFVRDYDAGKYPELVDIMTLVNNYKI